jgi:hypothetical protein
MTRPLRLAFPSARTTSRRVVIAVSQFIATIRKAPCSSVSWLSLSSWRPAGTAASRLRRRWTGYDLHDSDALRKCWYSLKYCDRPALFRKRNPHLGQCIIRFPAETNGCRHQFTLRGKRGQTGRDQVSVHKPHAGRHVLQVLQRKCRLPSAIAAANYSASRHLANSYGRSITPVAAPFSREGTARHCTYCRRTACALVRLRNVPEFHSWAYLRARAANAKISATAWTPPLTKNANFLKGRWRFLTAQNRQT